MHDIKAIRDNPQAFDEGLKRRGIHGDGEGRFSSEAILKLDEARRAHVTRLQEVQARRNAASKEIGAAKKAKKEVQSPRLSLGSPRVAADSRKCLSLCIAAVTVRFRYQQMYSLHV